MYKYCLVCLLLAVSAFGQAAGAKPAQAATPAPTASPAKPAAPEVAATATVVTIKGLCESKVDKNDPACVTTMTRAQFEKLIDAVQPSMPPRSRRPFADRYAHTLMMAKKAESMGLDKSPTFEDRMR